MPQVVLFSLCFGQGPTNDRRHSVMVEKRRIELPTSTPLITSWIDFNLLSQTRKWTFQMDDERSD